MRFSYKVIGVPEGTPLSEHESYDVVVKLSNGKCHGLTFFTIENVRELMERWKGQDEEGGGYYF